MHGSAKLAQTSFIPEFGIWVYFKRLWFGEFKKVLLHHFDDPVPWKQSKSLMINPIIINKWKNIWGRKPVCAAHVTSWVKGDAYFAHCM